MEICKQNMFNLDNIHSEKVKIICRSPFLSLKIKVLILLKSNDICQVFNLTQEELKEYKDNFFNIDTLVEMGRPYIISYLEETRQKELLFYYIKGEEYAKAKLGLVNRLSQDSKSILYEDLIQNTLIDSLNCDNIDTKLRCIKTLEKNIQPPKKEDLIDKLADLIKESDI